MNFQDVTGIIAQELQPAILAAAAVETLFSHKTGAEKLQAAVQLIETGLAGAAIAKPNSAVASNLQPIAVAVPDLVNSAVNLLNLFGLFNHKPK